MPQSARSALSKDAMFLPGPGAYNPEKLDSSRSHTPTFPKSGRPDITKNAPTSPGPGKYETPIKPEGPKFTIAKRYEDQAKRYYSQLPGPGQYAPSNSKSVLLANNKSIDHSMRFSGHDSSWLFKKEDFYTPGPGDYQDPPKNKKNAFSFTKQRREKVSTFQPPGPGAYQLPSTFAELPSYVQIKPKPVNKYP
eukprot:TRINITY_DN4212_c0_g1_i2.p1 TRINITY_DN4212_c0_g1~~TRINITY_DN4212_c0_g1_i2.p1  ORF type:complete len:193 (-),score=33.61 TRINITY_DN4212_c0_g1_i2:142-720(-)